MSEQERRQQEQARQMRSFAAAFAQGQAKAVDRFGNEFQPGDKVMVRFGLDPVVDVVSVNPVLDPRAQPGLIDVVCTVTFPLRIPSGRPYEAANIVARRQEAVPAPGSDNGKGPALSLVPAAPVEPEPAVADSTPGDDDEPTVV